MKITIKNILKFMGCVALCSMGMVAYAQDAPPDTVDIVKEEKIGSQLVPVAYGVKERRAINGAVSYLDGTEMTKTLTPTLSNTLYGRVPGLTVMQGSGEPGYDSPSMLIRGLGTYNDNGFLVLVDGFEASFDQLSVEEIESVVVLKDAASLALYGIRGANGALLVTTKRGQQQKAKITFNARYGWQQPTRLPEFLGSYDYARLYNEAAINDGLEAPYSEEDLAAYQNGTDPYLHPDVNWYDEVLKDSAPISEYNVSFNGGNDNMKYFVLLGHMRNEGLYANTDEDRKINSNADFRRYNFRTNIDVKLSDAVRGSLDLGGRIEDRSFPNFNGPSLWQNMARYPANAYPVINPDGTWGGNSVYPDNPVASIIDRGYTSSHDRNLMATLRMSEKLDFITEGLTFHQALSDNNWHRGNYNKTKTYTYSELTIGQTNDGRDSLIYVTHGTETDFSVGDGSSDSYNYNDQYNRMNVQLALDYNHRWDNSGIYALLMYHQDVYTISGNNVPAAQQSIMGRISYDYKEKYYAELAYSYSGSENFPKGDRFGIFPALSLGWIVSEEDFLKDKTALSYLKLRASAGLVGNDRLIGNRFAYSHDFYYSGSYYYFGPNVTGNNSVTEGTIGNPDITWEKSMQFNFGIDGQFFDNTLGINLDAFYEKRHDVLASANATVPDYLGVDAPYENVGKVNNRGIELDINYQNSIGDFNYYVGLTGFYTKNKIIEMNEVVRPEDYLYRTGHPINAYFGLESDGFYQQADFDAQGELVDGLPVSTFAPVQPGDIKYKDLNDDGLIDQNDETFIGDPNAPALTYSLQLGAEYKGFYAQVFFHGIGERSVYLNGPYFWALVDENNIGTNALGRWTPENANNATYPRLTTQPNENNYRLSDFWLKSGKVLRLRNVEVGYTLPAHWLDGVKINSARIYASGVNLFTWDDVDRLDPENLGGYPVLKSFSLGARLEF
ncbi:TonB-dependent receptor [Fulvivirga maritima]|uniref:SusC/RagA family TonB-linked outer membrane protein n=1 Tax=Fulvivirga maritima TaxID=2904247 RepID=UPI001F35D772|nr:TonB-dependent receptor [Fulvivirga maritima]UII24878.1 TonB-dependent receptor [Fulvivirga maritima]